MGISRRSIYWRGARAPRSAASSPLRLSPRRGRTCRRAVGHPRLWRSASSLFRLPGMTLGLTHARRLLDCPGISACQSRRADTDHARHAVPDRLDQQVMIAAVLHQFAAEGRFRLTDRLSDLLPGVPFLPGTRSRSSTCSTMSRGCRATPRVPRGGLWTAYPPGRHWHYSNTAYEILGKLAEHFGGKPLASCCANASSCRSA